jgi:hypothetical protein
MGDCHPVLRVPLGGGPEAGHGYTVAVSPNHNAHTRGTCHLCACHPAMKGSQTGGAGCPGQVLFGKASTAQKADPARTLQLSAWGHSKHPCQADELIHAISYLLPPGWMLVAWVPCVCVLSVRRGGGSKCDNPTPRLPSIPCPSCPHAVTAGPLTHHTTQIQRRAHIHDTHM